MAFAAAANRMVSKIERESLASPHLASTSRAESGEAQDDILGPECDRRVMPQFRESVITSHAVQLDFAAANAA